MKPVLLHIFGLSLLCTTLACAQNESSRLSFLERWSKHSFYVLPAVDYTPETNWSFGVTGANYFKVGSGHRTSSVSYSARYSLNRQYSFTANTRLYMGEHAYLYATLSVGKFPDYFYGIGNQESLLLSSPLFYDPIRVQFKAQPMWSVSKDWMIGPAFQLHYEHMDNAPVAELYSDFCVWGLGVASQYDSRDNNFYPRQGTFFKVLLLGTEPTFGSSIRSVQLQADCRQFIPIHTCVLALQLYADMLYQSNSIVQLLPIIGGADVARGIRRGMWRDDVALAFQAEFRIPIWKPIKAAVFGSVADVYNWEKWQWGIPKVGYGAGLRLAFNQAKVNLRLDVARNNYGGWKYFGNPNTWNFYLTATEAF